MRSGAPAAAWPLDTHTHTAGVEPSLWSVNILCVKVVWKSHVLYKLLCFSACLVKVSSSKAATLWPSDLNTSWHWDCSESFNCFSPTRWDVVVLDSVSRLTLQAKLVSQQRPEEWSCCQPWILVYLSSEPSEM